MPSYVSKSRQLALTETGRDFAVSVKFFFSFSDGLKCVCPVHLCNWQCSCNLNTHPGRQNVEIIISPNTELGGG